MRSSKKETRALFLKENVAYQDTTLQIEDKELHYIQTGNDKAPTLVFIHGSPGSWNAYQSYLTDSVLLKKYRMIALDRPGFGYSDFRKSMGLKPQAQLLNKLLTRLDNGAPYTLIGHSYGGPLIVQMAIEQPNLYTHLAILAGALDPSAEKKERWRYPIGVFPLKYLVPGALKPSNEELIMLKKDLKTLKEDLHMLSQHVLIIHGAKDKLVPYSNVAFMEKEFTDVSSLKVLTLEDQNHFFVWEREAFVKENIDAWLKKTETP